MNSKAHLNEVVVVETTELRAEYSEPTLIRHGAISVLTRNAEGDGSDGGDPGYTASFS